MSERLSSRPSTKETVSGQPGRSLSVRVERLIAAIRRVINPDRSWEEPMRLLMTHPRPSLPLRELRDKLRIVIRRSTYDERAVDSLFAAAAAADRYADLTEFFEPIQWALLALATSLSSRPAFLMQTAWRLIDEGGVHLAAMPSSRRRATYLFGKPRNKVPAARETINLAVARTIAAVLQWCASDSTTGHDVPQRHPQDALDALWLAYVYCKTGTVGTQLSVTELRDDFEQFGAPLWRRLASQIDRASSGAFGARNPPAVGDLARLTLFLDGSKQSVETKGPLSEAKLAVDRHVVCKRLIPASASKEDKEEIERHKILEQALPVVTMPPVEELRSMELTLHAEFPWAFSSLDVIFGDLIGRANLGFRNLVIPPTLLVGPPGSGKSRLARRLAECFAIPRLDVCLAGTSDTKVLSGTSRGWAGGRPGDVASLMVRSECASALVTLDEIDKATDHLRGGGINAYLLGLFERETASHHYDSFLKTECDFSLVSWICTANALSTLSGPLRSRLRILSLPQPGREHLPAVAASVLQEMEKQWTIAEGILPKVCDLDLDFTSLTSARQARAAVEAQVTAWSRSIVKH